MNKIYYLPKFQEPASKLPKIPEIKEVRDNTMTSWTPTNNFSLNTKNIDTSNIRLDDGITGMIPYVGDALSIGQIGADLKDKNYKQAAIGTGLLLVPNLLEKTILKPLLKPLLKTTRSSKKGSTWVDQAIYLRHNDLKNEWKDFSEEELQKHLNIGNTNKQKQQYLDKTYNGQYTTTPEQQFLRINNTSDDRLKFINEHPVKELPSYTNIDEQMQFANRSWANDKLETFRNSLNENVEYSVPSEKMRKGEIGYSEGSIINGLWGGKPKGQIKTVYAKDDYSPEALITLGHEAAVHGSGAIGDEYIVQYLKENNIVDFDNVHPYFKDADGGEVSSHLSELPSWLGFRKDTPTAKYMTPEGKTKISKEDVLKFKEYLENTMRIPQAHSIIGNIKDWKGFLHFINNYKFGIAPMLIGVSSIQKNKNDSNKN